MIKAVGIRIDKGAAVMDQSLIFGHYSIGKVADITGLSKQVIRKWEERYGVVDPQRLDNGYRVYSEDDIKRLLSIKALVQQGMSIKQASLALESSVTMKTGTNVPVQEYTSVNHYVFELLYEGTQYNDAGLHSVMQNALHDLGLESFLKGVISPFLKEVGLRWESGQWNESQESLASFAVRDFLIGIRRSFIPKDNAPVVIGACLPYEYHELPVLILLLHMMQKNWRTVLIGASPAPQSIPMMVKQIKPDVVLLSAITTIPFERDPFLIERMEQLAIRHRNTAFYLGGPGAIQFTNGFKLNKVKVAESIEEVLKDISDP